MHEGCDICALLMLPDLYCDGEIPVGAAIDASGWLMENISTSELAQIADGEHREH